MFASTLIGHKMDLKFVEDYKYLHKKIIELERFLTKPYGVTLEKSPVPRESRGLTVKLLQHDHLFDITMSARVNFIKVYATAHFLPTFIPSVPDDPLVARFLKPVD